MYPVLTQRRVGYIAQLLKQKFAAANLVILRLIQNYHIFFKKKSYVRGYSCSESHASYLVSARVDYSK